MTILSFSNFQICYEKSRLKIISTYTPSLLQICKMQAFTVLSIPYQLQQSLSESLLIEAIKNSMSIELIYRWVEILLANGKGQCEMNKLRNYLTNERHDSCSMCLRQNR